MKTELDEIGSTYLFLDEVVAKDRELFIKLNQASVATEKKDIHLAENATINDCRQISVADYSLGFIVHFEYVLLYLAHDECAGSYQNEVVESSGVVLKFTESPLLEFAKNNTLLFDTHSGEIEHYCVQTADDDIHVLSTGRPEIRSENA